MINPSNYKMEKTKTIIDLLEQIIPQLPPLSWIRLHSTYYKKKKEEIIQEYNLAANCIQLLNQRNVDTSYYIHILKNNESFEIIDFLEENG